MSHQRKLQANASSARSMDRDTLRAAPAAGAQGRLLPAHLLTADTVRNLQRAVGNQAVGRLLSGATQQHQSRAAARMLVQRRDYLPNEATPPAADVRHTQVTVQNVTTPRRMEARGLSKHTIGGGSQRGSLDDHSNLYKLFYQHRTFPHDTLQDLHLLHEELGGPGKPHNLVPAPEESNNNMMDFERMVIDRLVNTPIKALFRVIDYEVSVNYGRAGNGLQAALPTSLDLRMTEQQTKDEGATWIDDGMTLVRNLAVRPKSKVGDADVQAAPTNEGPVDIGKPLLPAKNPIGRVVNALFIGLQEASKRVFDPSKLYYLKDYKLVSEHIEDPNYHWDQSKLNAYLLYHINAMLNHLRHIAVSDLAERKIPGDIKQYLLNNLDTNFKNESDFNSQKIFSDVLQKLPSFDKKKPFGNWPKEFLHYAEASFWPERHLESMSEDWFNIEMKYKQEDTQSSHSKETKHQTDSEMEIASSSKEDSLLDSFATYQRDPNTLVAMAMEEQILFLISQHEKSIKPELLQSFRTLAFEVARDRYFNAIKHLHSPKVRHVVNFQQPFEALNPPPMFQSLSGESLYTKVAQFEVTEIWKKVMG